MVANKSAKPDEEAKTVATDQSEAGTAETQETVAADSAANDIEDAVVIEASGSEPAADVHAQAAPKPAKGVVPLLAAGAVSAALGFGAAYLANQSADQAVADALIQSNQISETLSAQVKALEDRVADMDIDGAVAGVEASASARIDEATTEFSSQLMALTERVIALEALPTIDGGVSPAAVAQFEAEIARLRDELTTQQDRMTALAADAATQLEQTRASAEAIEASAANAARDAAARAALAQVRAAIESGEAYASAMPDLTAATGPLPAALVAGASEGVPTLGALQEAYPDVARLALAAARSDGSAGEPATGVVAFIRNQFDVRSVAPKEGDDTDAILSRVGAALAFGDLDTVIVEAAALPEVAKGQLADWLARVTDRADALSALASINLSQN